jgi:hypothetical protein
MNLLKPLAAGTCAVALLFTQVQIPLSALAATPQAAITKEKPIRAEKPGKPITKPEKPVQRTKKWSEYDWDEERVFPRDIEAYLHELDKLEEAGDREGIANLTPKKSRLSDDDVMDYYRVPAEIKKAVKDIKQRSVKDKPGKEPKKNIELSDQLEMELKDKLSRLPSDRARGIDKKPSKHLADEDLPRIKADKVKKIPKGKLKKLSEDEEQATDGFEEDPQAAESEAKLERYKKGILEKSTRANPEGGFTAMSVPTTPLIDYYDGIESHPVEHALFYLSSQVNEDGSIGDTRIIETTYEFALTLSKFGMDDTDYYANAISFLTNTTPQNTRELAIKALVLHSQGTDAQPLLDELMEARSPFDGGFGLHSGYDSDIESSLLAAKAFAVITTQEDITIAGALRYVVSRIQADGRITTGNDTSPNYYLMNLAIEHFRYYEGTSFTLNGTEYFVLDEANRMLDFLVERYSPLSLSLLDSSGVSDDLLFLANLREYQRDAELQDELFDGLRYRKDAFGSYDGSIFGTIAGLKGMARPDIVFTSIEATTPLKQGDSFTLKSYITNRGYAPQMGRTYHLFFDDISRFNPSVFTTVMAPGATRSFTKTYSDTFSKRLVGDVKVTYFVETPDEYNGDDNWITEQFTFAEDDNQVPAVPLYFTFYELNSAGEMGVNVRTHNKADPDRKEYVLMIREKGSTGNWSGTEFDTTWDGAFITDITTEEGEPVLVHGQEYDMTLGVRDNNDDTVWFIDSITSDIVISPEGGDPVTGTIQGTVTLDHLSMPYQTSLRGHGFVNVSTDQDGAYIIEGHPNGSTAMWIDHDAYQKLIRQAWVPDGGTTTRRVFTHLKEDDTPPTVNSISVIGHQPGAVIPNDREIEILVEASDETAIREVDIHYYDPVEGVWLYLGSNEMEGNVATIPWYIPSSLSGQGFDLRAIAVDYRGNRSTELEWGSFELVEGGGAEGQVTIPSLTGGEWALDESHAITWQLTSQNPITNIKEVVLHYEGEEKTIARDLNPADGQYSYQMPANTLYVTTGAYVSLEACDQYNVCTVVSSDTFEIVDNTGVSERWGEPTAANFLARQTDFDQYLYGVFGSMDTTLHIIYKQYDWTNENYYTDGIYYKRYTGGSWSTPVMIKSDSYVPGNRIEYRSFNVRQPENDDILITFARQYGSGHAGLDNAEIFYARVSNGVLAEQQQISNDNTSSKTQDVVMTANGDIHVVWREGYSYVSQSGDSLLRYRMRPNGGTWTPRQTLTQHPVSKIQMLTEDNEPLIWYDAGSQPESYLLKKSAGTWGNPIPIVTPWIPKTILDAYTEDAAKLPLIVEDDPTDPTRYRWLSSITSQADLATILATNTFVNEAAILDDWEDHQFARLGYPYAQKMFAGNAPDEYHIIHRKYHSSRYDIDYVAFVVDDTTATAMVTDIVPITDKVSSGNDVRASKVVQNNAGDYHLFYVVTEQGESNEHGYHAIFNGVFTMHEDMVASSLLDFSQTDQEIYIAEEDDIATVFFMEASDGESPFWNSAEFTGYSDSFELEVRLNLPLPGSTVTSGDVTLQWSFIGTGATGYDLYMGTDAGNLTLEATGITNTSYATSGLTADTYYWQVAADTAEGTIFSDIASFTVNLAGAVTISPSSTNYDFPGTPVGSSSLHNFTIMNIGGDDLSVTSVTSSDNTVFPMQNEDCTTGDIAPQATCGIEIAFAPEAEGNFTADLTINSNDTNTPTLTIPLTGFTSTGSVSPTISFIEPDGVDDNGAGNFTIRWDDEDPDDDASIALYYDTDNTGEDGTLIIDALSEDTSATSNTVFNDTLEPAWVNWSWDTTLTEENDTMKVEHTAAWGGLYFNTTAFSVQDHTDFSFRINGGPTAGQDINFAFYDENGIEFAWQQLSSFVPGGTLQPDTWYDISIPLPGIGQTMVSGILFQDANGAVQPYYFLDDIRFNGGEIDYYNWDTTAVADGSYYLYAVIDDGTNQPVTAYSTHQVTINSNVAPTFSFVEPDGTGDTADAEFEITWTDEDPDDNASIDLYYDTDNTGGDGTQIVADLDEDDLNIYGVFADTLQPGWANWSWGTNTAISSTYVSGGTHSLEVEHTGQWAGLYLNHNTIDVASYDGITFAINGGPTGGQDLEISFYDETGTEFGATSLASYLPGTTLDTDTWHEITIPFDIVGATLVSGVLLMTADGNAASAYYIDEMTFDGPEIDSYLWDTLGIPDGVYYLYAEIADLTNTMSRIYSDNPVTISH